MEVQNFDAKYEAIEKMLKHWTYRTLNLDPLATVLPELDNRKAKKMEDLTVRFIWRTFKDQTEQKSTRVKLNSKTKARKRRAGNNGHKTVLDVSKNWLVKEAKDQRLQ